MRSIVEFYKSLPKRKCRKCGQDIKEKADCYIRLCDHCNHPAK